MPNSKPQTKICD